MAKRRVIYEVADDDVLFVRRAAAYLWNKRPREVIVVAIDNVDRHEIPWRRQLALVHRTFSLLESSRHLISIVPLREYTLGNIVQITAARRYHHLDRMHITTPIIGKVLQRRLGMYCDQASMKSGTKLSLTRDISVTFKDYQGIVRAIADAVDDHSYNNGFRGRGSRGRDDSRLSVSRFLNDVTNSDLRAALQILLNALRSWALAVDSAVIHYLVERDKNRAATLPCFTLDELVRLSCVGEWTFYEEAKGSGVINLFGRGGERPMPEAGRFPCLITYRVLEYLDHYGDSPRDIEVKKLRDSLTIFGYTLPNIDRLLNDLIRNGFVESPEGTRLEHIRTFAKTRKAVYYLHTLCKLLTYLENVRNDVMITYKSDPHHVRDNICDDLLEVFSFIDFLFRSEIEELAFIRRRDEAEHIHTREKILCERFLGSQPLCWRMLRSVADRARALYIDNKSLFDPSKTHEVEKRFVSLRDAIISATRNNGLLPKIRPDKQFIRLDLC